MSGESQLLLWIAGVHLLGLVCVAALLIPAFRDDTHGTGRRPDQGSDDGPGNDRRPPPGPSGAPSGGIPLPDAEPARARLREPGRLSERVPRPERRPAREPEREPVRTPERI
jgi:hypothetical protein